MDKAHLVWSVRRALDARAHAARTTERHQLGQCDLRDAAQAEADAAQIEAELWAFIARVVAD